MSAREGTMSPEGPDDRQELMDELRAVNERLLVSSMQAQELAEQAETSRTDAETANRLKDEFVAVVSHELRTPLSAVLGWAHLLGTGRLDPARTAHAIATIERNGRSMARIIDDLLDVARMGGGGVRIDRDRVDLLAVVRAALDEVRLAAEARALEVKLVCAETAPHLVMGDATRLQQVVANLLSNAIKFTPPRGRIEVRLGTEGPQSVIQVSDKGQGIAPDFLPHVFDRFAQGDTSTTRRAGGLGLGLAIVRALVERHHGTVQVESAGLGQGATFTVRLPTVASVSTTPDPTPGSPAVRPAAGTMRLGGVRVLLVEDDQDTREALVLLLGAAGAAVVATESVKDALNAFDATRPHVILCDIGLPDADGFALLREVRARETGSAPAIPAVALTGFVRSEDRERILGAGFDAHIGKPVDANLIVDLIAPLAAPSGEVRHGHAPRT